jgi:hypothetical protein
MRRLFGLAALAVTILIPVSASRAELPYCEDGPPPQPAGGTVTVNPPQPVVNDDINVGANFADDRPYVDGSTRVKIDAPDGTTVTYNPDKQATYRPKQIGQYVATVTAQYYGCANSIPGDPVYVTDTAGPTAFDVVAGKDPAMFIKAIVRRSRGSGHGSAFLQANIECGDSTVAAGTPVTFTIYYETGGRLPSHSSPHIAGTSPNGCQGRSPKDTEVRRTKRLYWMDASGGSAQLNVSEPQRMRVLIEMTRDGRVLAASRASFKKGAPGEAVVRDKGSCAAAKGCQRFKTTFI